MILWLWNLMKMKEVSRFGTVLDGHSSCFESHTHVVFCEIDASGALPKCHIPARFAVMIPREYQTTKKTAPSSQSKASSSESKQATKRASKKATPAAQQAGDQSEQALSSMLSEMDDALGDFGDGLVDFGAGGS